jgi:endonuclease/exonuclease/phosphatase family metal-dependent hydrolase
MTPLRIVSYNVRYFSQLSRGLMASRRALERVAAAIAALEPHIVCLQEVEGASLRSRGVAQLDALAKTLGERYHARWFSAHTGSLVSTGLGVLTTLDVLADESVTLPGGRERRIAAHLELRHEGKRLHLFNSHLSLPRPIWKRLGWAANQIVQAERLAELVRDRAGDRPLILGGDFNAQPSSPVVRCFDQHLASDGPTVSAAFGPFRRRLDHLFAGNGVIWLDSDGTHPVGAGPFRGLSDHMPLIARISL